MPIYLLASFIRTAKNVAPYLQLLSSNLSVTGYIASFSVRMPSEWDGARSPNKGWG
jgi:hypothetical protein